MSKKITLPFTNEEGNTYKLNIDLDILSKENSILKAITGMGHTVEKKQQPIVADDDLSRLPDIFDIIKDMNRTSKKNWWPWPIFAGNKKTQNVKPMPSPNDSPDKTINFGEGHNLYNTKPLPCSRNNPFIPPLNKIEPSTIEGEVLSWFKSAVVEAKSISELKKTVNEALSAGVRINSYPEGQRSFADTVILKMLSIPCTEDEQKDIIRELLLNWAVFNYDLLQNKQISKVYNKLCREVQPNRDKQLRALKEVGKTAVQGGVVEEAGIDNKTFYMKFSGGTVEPAKVLEGARKLGLNAGWVELGGHIMKVGDNEFEVKVEEGGTRNYVGLSDGNGLSMTLNSTLGKLIIHLRHNAENGDLVQVTVENEELWNRLQEAGDVITDNCLLGGKTIEEAVKAGYFERSGMFSKEQVTEKIKAVNGSSEKVSSWVDKTCGDSSKGLSRG